MKNLTKNEKSLILFLECCIVDNRCKVNTAHLNKEDMQLAKKWNDEVFIRFKRLKSYELDGKNTHYVQFTDDAWKIAHAERYARGLRQTIAFEESRKEVENDLNSCSIYTNSL